MNAVEQSLDAGYKAVREGGAGIIDLTSRGRIRVEGSEAVMFLNGLITNDMKTLEIHRWMPAAFPNVQGRLIAAVRVMRPGDKSETSPVFIIDTEAATRQAVLKTIERFTMAGDFKVTDITETTSMLSIQGPKATEVVRSVIAAEIPRYGVLETESDSGFVTALRASHTAEDGIDLIFDETDRHVLVDILTKAGATTVSAEAAETLRIEAGIGAFGKDMDETNVITEANLDDSVSFTKGCYIGQEIIARIKYRGHVAKKLTGLTLENSDAIAVGEVIKAADGKEIGRVTSTTFSPALNRTIALAYVRYEHLAPGTGVVVGESNLKAQVTELPFVRGSWYESDE
jgi:folate-binding protein YgfZ